MTTKSLTQNEPSRRDPAAAATGSPQPRRRRKAARPGEIIAAGLAEFAARGFAATRLEDVARRAGIAKGTIYRYFPDKEALFLAALRSRIPPIIGEMAATVEHFPGSTRQVLEVLIRQVHREIVETELRTLMRIIIAEGESFPALTELYYREVVAKGRALIERVVARGIVRGEVRAGPFADLPLMIMAPAIMASVWMMTFQGQAPLAAEAVLAAHLDMVTNALLLPDVAGSPGAAP